MIRLTISLIAVLLVAGCSDSQHGDRQISVRAEGVTLARCAVKSGHTSDTNLVSGLQRAANVLSELYTNASQTYPGVKGHFRGILQVEYRGNIRMIMEHGSEVSPVEAKGVLINDFIAATFGGAWYFPPLGDDCLIEVDFAIGKNGDARVGN
jgi:hypothetical protein